MVVSSRENHVMDCEMLFFLFLFIISRVLHAYIITRDEIYLLARNVVQWSRFKALAEAQNSLMMAHDVVLTQTHLFC